MRTRTLLLLCVPILSLSACQAAGNVCIDGSGPGCDTVISDLRIDKPRFEFPSTQPVAGGQDFWLRAGDNLNAAWDTYIISLAKPGVMCTTMSPASPPACEQCNFTNLNGHDCPNAFATLPGVAFLTIESFAGFDLDSPPVVLANIVSGLANRSISLTPAANATIRLSTPINDRGTLAESKVFVLSDGTPQSVTFPLQPLDQSVDGVGFYSGSVPRNPLLTDNFSTNLRIGRVRLLKGHPENDPSTGKLHVKDASVVRPSRIVLIPDYSGGQVYSSDSLRCYSDSSPDGALDFTNCRTTSGGGGALLDATPAYLKLAPRSVLTWVAEFRPSEGGVPPVLGSGEILAIEFTIQ